jgi:hypothetical protein
MSQSGVVDFSEAWRLTEFLAIHIRIWSRRRPCVYGNG